MNRYVVNRSGDKTVKDGILKGFSEYQVSAFKDMFRRACRNSIGDGNCDPGDCEFCPVDKAWDMLFGDD